MKREEAEIKLKETFGIPKFYDEQWEAIERIFKGERILMIQKTGFGKSLCYQFPATQFPGLTVIFSPLVALMRDQVKNLKKHGIDAGFINYEQSPEDNDKTIEAAKRGALKILYISQERQENQKWIESMHELRLSMVVIDEAHTISTWGHDFRPAFRRIIDLVKLLPSHLPILATTATATLKVQKDIEAQIGGKLTTIMCSLVRDNFRLYVIKVESEEEKYLWLAQNLMKLPGTGLIYSGTRVDTELYAKWFQYIKFPTTEYHAGLDPEYRKDIENGLMENRWKAIISTNALGMGMDKPDIRFVIHTQIPQSPVHYYQEIGRAGRDGRPTIVILFYNYSVEKDGVVEDVKLPTSFIENARPSLSKYNKVISLLKNEPLGMREIVKGANIKSPQFTIIKADLMEQGIIREVKYGNSKKYECVINAPALDPSGFEALRISKLEELNKMIGYVETTEPRMKYLCDFLDDTAYHHHDNCDNTSLKSLSYDHNIALEAQLKDFQMNLFPEIELASTTTKKINERKFTIRFSGVNRVEIFEDGSAISEFYQGKFQPTFEESESIKNLINDHCLKKSHLTDGYASSYYCVSAVGNAIHRSKYENGGDFPDFLLKNCLRLIGKKYNGVKFDLVCYIPPAKSGNLVRNFAEKIAKTIDVPISHDLIKTRENEEQKMFQSSFSKQENIGGAFDFDSPEILKNKTILLIDDIYDSGTTLKEAGRILSLHGAKWVVPLVIAKTVGGTL